MDLVKKIWLRTWNGKPPRPILLILNIIASLIMILPVLYILFRAVSAPVEKWGLIFKTRIPILIWNTMSLAGSVAMITTIVGVGLAWLIEYTNLPGRRFFKIALILPLAIPPYIGALTYVIFFGKRGILYAFIGSSIVDIFSFFSVAIVLSLFTFPYVFLIVSASLKKISANYEEAGRSCGGSSYLIFRRITLPLVSPAILSSSIIILFYIMSDFAAVSMLRYSTFTSSIYFQMVGKLDRQGAAILSSVLIALGLAILFIKSRIQKNKIFYQDPKSNRELKPIDLGKYKHIFVFLVSIILFFSVILPVVTLLGWSIKGIYGGAVTLKMLGYIKNSFMISMGTVFVTMFISVPMAYIKFRNPSKITSVMNGICHMGLIIPGTLLALGMVFIINRFFPWLVGSLVILIIGYSIRYLSRNLQSVEASMGLISPNLDETAYSLGTKFWTVLFKVILPSILPGVLSGGILVLVSSLKELPITLMLRPPGFDTLAVRIWIQASGGFYTHAAPAGLLVVLISIIPLYFMAKKEGGD